jgi:dTDP-4-amino-4,6-dideoxygalactose transaminase
MATPQLADPIPFLDLSLGIEPIREQILADIADIFASGAFINGPAVREFEEEFATYCGVEHCIGLASGLDALRLALEALDLERGSEVLVPAMTFIATWEAVTQAGGVPVPVDVSPDDYGIDLRAVRASAGSRTRALVPVHLYGQMVDPVELRRLAVSHDLAVVEDACQSHGARRGGLGAGTVGDAAAFSFYPGKNLGAAGDAGALVTGDAQLASRVRALREHGQAVKGTHLSVGWTARLDTIQAAVLLRKLPLLDRWNVERRAAADWYREALAEVGDLVLPAVGDASVPVWHVYVVRTADPIALGNHLRAHGIHTGRHYSEPPHLSAAYASLGHGPGSFPVAEALAREVLSLPMFPGITRQQVETTAAAIAEYFRRPR